MADNAVKLAGNETMVVTGLDANGVLHPRSPFWAQLQATLNLLPAHAFYALPFHAPLLPAAAAMVTNHNSVN